MIAIFLAPFYILVNLYLARWVLRWTGACHRLCGTKVFRAVFLVVYALVAAAPLTGFLIRSPDALRKALLRTGNFWFGWMLYLVLAVLAVELGLFLVRRARGRDFEQMQRVRRVQGGIALALVCAVSGYGMVHAEQLCVTDYAVTLPGQGEDMTVALAADLHLGYSTDPAYIERAVSEINAMQPDLVVVAGDVFDNEYEAIPEPDRIAAALASIESAYGTYACWGNHDVSEPILAGFTWDDADADKDDPRMREFLEKSGINLLEDRVVTLPNGVQLAGRKDASRSKKLEETRQDAPSLLAACDPDAPVFVIDHQPNDNRALAQAGADLVLSGHTHDGQLFPANLLMVVLWDNPCGCQKVEGAYSVVTSGLGVWGPAMRVGTRSEVVCLTVHFAG